MASISSGQEWDDLLRRCIGSPRVELVESFRSIVTALGSEDASYLSHNLGRGLAERVDAPRVDLHRPRLGRAGHPQLVLIGSPVRPLQRWLPNDPPLGRRAADPVLRPPLASAYRRILRRLVTVAPTAV